MDFLEKDLESILYYAPQLKIKERGLSCFVYDTIFRQVSLGAYGISDLITVKYVNKFVYINIYELKNKVLSAAVFWQILKYIKGVNHFLSNFNLSNHNIIVRGIMIGRTIDAAGEFCFLPTLNSNIHIYTYDYNYDGILFNYINDIYERSNFKDIDLEQFGQDNTVGLAKLVMSSLYKLPEETLQNV